MTTVNSTKWVCYCAPILFAFLVQVPGRGASTLPRFEDYPAGQIYVGPPAAPKLTTPLEQSFAAEINDTVEYAYSDKSQQKGPNFAGRLIVVRWGCGAPCMRMALVDVQTGEIYYPPITYDGHGPKSFDLPLLALGREYPQNPDLEFRPNSNLMVIKATPSDAGSHPSYTFYFLWRQSGWTLLRKVPIVVPAGRSPSMNRSRLARAVALCLVDDPSLRATERTLEAVLQWEILWNDSPKGFRLPDGSITLAMNVAPGFVSYCSHQAGVCVTYRTGDYRNWEGVSSARCDDNRSDQDALLAFIGKETVKHPLVLGRGGLSGSPAPESGITWTTRVNLGTRTEIVKQYQQKHPQEIEGLQNWIRAATTRDSGVKSISIACFGPSDPMVYYYVDRPAKGSVVMAVFWDRERQSWVVASSLERSQGSQRLDEMHRTIESVVCSTLNFE